MAPPTGCREINIVTNPEYLLPELLAPMVRNTIFSGNIHHCVQADSTNSIALRGAALAGQHPDDTPEGAVFLAEEQTAGVDAAPTPGTLNAAPASIVHSCCVRP